MSSPIRLMAHMVAGYPDREISDGVAQALVEGGAAYLEIQLPFSDPSADGKAIQTACARVLADGFTITEGIAQIRAISHRYPDIPIFVMTYANLAYKRGIDEFVGEMAISGVSGLIIPDLPFDCDEGLEDSCRAYGLCSVPVAAPSMSEQRKKQLRDLNRPYVYAALRSGITGSRTEIDEHTISFLSEISGSSKVLGGFGIRTGNQAEQLAPYVHAVVAGSVFVELIAANQQEGIQVIQTAVRKKAKELTTTL
jgi:tryptophan synthase alpha chain